jgi:hypothetical protein
MLPGVALAAALLSPAAPLPARAEDVRLYRLECYDRDGYWKVVLGKDRWSTTAYVVYPDLRLTIEGRRANLGELPGLLNEVGPGVRGSGPVWPRAKSCRAWTRGGRLEALEISLR